MDEDAVYINSFQLNETFKQARFFLGDRWLVIGDLVMVFDKLGCTVQVPDVEAFLRYREYLDDGTFEWATWGPRVN